jgi:CO/xanthine dehydrogenase Mo-binding subunit
MTRSVTRRLLIPSLRIAALQRRYCNSSKNMGVTHAVARVHLGTPMYMRAPGSAPGLFALESAMDELAWKRKIGSGGVSIEESC